MSRSTPSFSSSEVSRRIISTPTARSTPSLRSGPLATSHSGSTPGRSHLPTASQQPVQRTSANLLSSSHRTPTSSSTRPTATPPHQRFPSVIQQIRPSSHPTSPPRKPTANKLMSRSVSSSPMGPGTSMDMPRSRVHQDTNLQARSAATITDNRLTQRGIMPSLQESTASKLTGRGVSPSSMGLAVNPKAPKDEKRRPASFFPVETTDIAFQTSSPRIVASPLPTLSPLENKNKERVTSLPAQEPKSDKKDLVPKESSSPRITERITPEKVDGPARTGTEEVSCREFMDSMVALSELELELSFDKLGSIPVRSKLEKWITEPSRDPTRFVFDSGAPEERNWRYNGYQDRNLASDIDVLDRALLLLSSLWPKYSRGLHFQIFQLKFMKTRLIEGDCAEEMVECLESTLLDRVARGLKQIDKLAELLLNGQCPRVPNAATGLLVQLKRRRDKYRWERSLNNSTSTASKVIKATSPIPLSSSTSLPSFPPRGAAPSSPKSPPIKPSPMRSHTHVHLPPANSIRPTPVPSTLPKSPPEETDSISSSSTESSNERKRSQQPCTPITAVEPKISLSVGRPVTSNLPCATSKNGDMEQPAISLPSTTWSPPSNSLATSTRRPLGILQIGVTAAAILHSYGYEKPITTSSSGLG